jgi:phage shock protein PspC (stress-responsive transcriptional regulator)
VCGGLGRYYDIDPVIFRIVFPVLAIFAGAGILLYAAGWLLIPEEGSAENEAQRLFGGRGSGSTVLAVLAVVLGGIVFLAWVGDGPSGPAVVLLAVVALLVFAANRRQDAASRQSPMNQGPSWAGSAGRSGTAAASFAPPPPYPPPPYPPSPPPAFSSPPPYPPPTYRGPSQVMPPPPRRAPAPPRESSPLPLLTVSVAALVAGALVLVGLAPSIEITAAVVAASVTVVIGLGLLVGAWFGRARSLIAVGVAAVLTLVAVATFDVPLRGGFGSRDWRPASVRDLDSPYRLGAGDARLDLTALTLPGRPVEVEATLGSGELVVIAPENADLVVAASAGLGQVDLPNGTTDGLGARREYRYEGETAGLDPARLVELHLKVGVGRVEVRRA